MTTRRSSRRVPKYLRRKAGTLRALPADGRCAVCGTALTAAVTYYVCSNPRCTGSPLLPLVRLSARTRRLIALREQRPDLVHDGPADAGKHPAPRRGAASGGNSSAGQETFFRATFFEIGSRFGCFLSTVYPMCV
ncbi:MAG: hypothetical protein IPM64_17835 [Phycisphaerales bacterium]|nr:hypothetical protein [Phycisphaerales bacterium]